MPDNKNNDKNNVISTNDGIIIAGNSNYLIHSLQSDNSNFVPPLISSLNGSAANNTTDNNNDDDDDK